MHLDKGTEWLIIVALFLFLVIAVWYVIQVNRQRKQIIRELHALVQAWMTLEMQANAVANSRNADGMTYPIHAAKASAYSGCIVDLQKTLYTLTDTTPIRKTHNG